MGLKLLYSSSSNFQLFGRADLVIYFANDIAFEASDDFAFALALLCSFFDVCERGFMATHSDNCYTIEGSICLPIAASVEPMTVGHAARGWDRTDTA